MSGQRQVYVVYWEHKDGKTIVDFLRNDAPLEVKRMIAEALLRDLGINIRIDTPNVGRILRTRTGNGHSGWVKGPPVG